MKQFIIEVYLSVAMLVQIRDYKEEDKEHLKAAIGKLHDFVVKIDPLERLRRMPGYIDQEIENILQTVSKQEGKIYIAENEDTFVGFIIGFTTTQTQENLLSVVPTKVGVISDVYVSEQYRGEHVGTQLIKHIEMYLKEKGCDTLWINIVAFNTKAHSFYNAMGYTDREIGLIKKI